VPYDPAWATEFTRVRERVRKALGETALAVEHVGSTAVPGLSAKPLIDILLVVSDSSDEATYVPPLERTGFTLHVREPQWHRHRLLKLERPKVNLHVFSLGCSEATRMLRFRDLLRGDHSARESYKARKQELAGREWNRVQDYADEKSATIAGLMKSKLRRR